MTEYSILVLTSLLGVLMWFAPALKKGKNGRLFTRITTAGWWGLSLYGVLFVLSVINIRQKARSVHEIDSLRQQLTIIGINNNAPNYGTQAGRDINIGTMHVNSEKELTADEIAEVLKYVQTHNSKCGMKHVVVMLSVGSNARGIYRQIVEMLKNAGYAVIVGELYGVVKDISFTYNEDSCVLIEIGTVD